MAKEEISKFPLPNEMYASVVSRLTEANWSVSGGMTTEGTVHATYGVPRTLSGEVSLEDAASRLGILEEEGDFSPGFKVYKAHAIFSFVVSYSGPYDNRLFTTAERMVEFTATNPESQ